MRLTVRGESGNGNFRRESLHLNVCQSKACSYQYFATEMEELPLAIEKCIIIEFLISVYVAI